MIKRRGGSQIGNLTFNHKSLESKCQIRFDWGMLYTTGENLLEGYKILPSNSQNRFDLRKNMNVQSFEIIRVIILELSLGSPREK
jgi:hypothetical protein